MDRKIPIFEAVACAFEAEAHFFTLMRSNPRSNAIHAFNNIFKKRTIQIMNEMQEIGD